MIRFIITKTTTKTVVLRFITVTIFACFATYSLGQGDPTTNRRDPQVPEERYILVEPFTAQTLKEGEAKLGLINFDLGLTDTLMAGTDFLADILGAPNVKTKFSVYKWGNNKFALGLRGAYVDRDTILWGSVKDHFKKLEARIVSPSISWTNRLSSRLRLHTLWGTGIGRVRAELTEKGKRKLWEIKHPNGNYDERETGSEDESTDGNQEQKSSDKPASFQQRTLLLSSVTGLLSDVFQITGEFERQGGNKVLVSSRVERTSIEDLRGQSFRFTMAQQWIWYNFQIRLGLGLQYVVVSGTDLDGEKIDEAGVLPASDIDFYWRF